MASPDYDVIVAGAGGAAAAYFLTRAGLRVLVVEKAHLPRYKACGGAIPRATLERFPFAFDSVIRAAPTAVRFAFPELPPVDLPLPDRPVVMVMRSEFDAFLLAHSGAEVLEAQAIATVTETSSAVKAVLGDQALSARYLVVATGAASSLAQRLGLRQHRRLGAALEVEVPLRSGSALYDEYGSRALFSLGAIPWGYAWVFPKETVLSVGIARMRPGRADLRPALEREVAGLGIGLAGLQLHGHPVPCYQAPCWPAWYLQGQERLSTRRCLLVGDAAGLVDPFIGEGIRYAVISARLAAEAILAGDLPAYEATLWREIGHSLATAGMVANLFYRQPVLCYRLGLHNPAVVREFVDVLAGRHSYQ